MGGRWGGREGEDEDDAEGGTVFGDVDDHLVVNIFDAQTNGPIRRAGKGMGAHCARWIGDCLPPCLPLSVTASTAMRPPGRRPTTAPKIDDCHLRHSKIAIPVNGHFGFVVRCRRHAQGAPGRQGEQVHLHAQLLTAIVIRYLLANPGTGSDSRGQREIYGFENFHFRLFPFADPSWREQSFSSKWIAIPKWGCGSLLFNSRARERGRVVTRLTPPSVVDGSSGVLKITSFLPPCLAPARAPVVGRRPLLPPLSYLEQSYLYPPCG